MLYKAKTQISLIAVSILKRYSITVINQHLRVGVSVGDQLQPSLKDFSSLPLISILVHFLTNGLLGFTFYPSLAKHFINKLFDAN